MSSKKFKKLLIIILLFITLVSIGINIFNYRTKNNTEIMSEKIEENIVSLAELSTVKYNYTDVVSYDDILNIGGIEIPFTNKGFIIKYSGYIKAGVDLTEIDIDINDKDKIVVNLKEPQILENIINEEEVAFFNEKDGLFNKLNYDELYELLKEEKTKKESYVINEGILNDAKRNTNEIIDAFLLELGFNKITINYKD